ncbi:MAG: electron transfer flavoprotein subunit alpha/FixB family protein [Flavobacteriales bacterium]|jgi:electron transfer flavoprotein alpha subunit|nr:electron transfer flavoprotein subunit alpha/FixB family protein [Flavobacteriales bacterium]
MSVLAIVSLKNGQPTKGGLEAASFAAAHAKSLGTDAVALVSGSIDGDGGLGATGVQRVLVHAGGITDSSQWAKLGAAAGLEIGADATVVSHDHFGRAVGPRMAVRIGAGMVSGVTALPKSGLVRKNVFSGKAMADVAVKQAKAVYSVTPNAFGIASDGGVATTESFDAEVGAVREQVVSFHAASEDGQTPLPEADLVVSAGRGLKGPENWGIVEDLAQALGATTACSRPVSDIGWRPHHEHVGQTGITIRPNLYIAAGISGAIQHLAGVNQSKVIVVINTDPEAPFFKAADYGIVGDAFEVLPRLTAAVRALNS